MRRHTAVLLVVVLGLSSGRLLACGWDCVDDAPIAGQASCHESASAQSTVNGGTPHPCPPEVSETPGTISQKSSLAGDGDANAVSKGALASRIAAATSAPYLPFAVLLVRARLSSVLRI